MVRLFPQTRTSALSSPCCALLTTSVTGCARPMGRPAPQGPTAGAPPASSSSVLSSRRHQSPTRRACCCAPVRLLTWAAGSAGATPSPPAARCRLAPPTAWSCGASATRTGCAGVGAGCRRAASIRPQCAPFPPGRLWAVLGLTLQGLCTDLATASLQNFMKLVSQKEYIVFYLCKNFRKHKNV